MLAYKCSLEVPVSWVSGMPRHAWWLDGFGPLLPGAPWEEGSNLPGSLAARLDVESDQSPSGDWIPRRAKFAAERPQCQWPPGQAGAWGAGFAKDLQLDPDPRRQAMEWREGHHLEEPTGLLSCSAIHAPVCAEDVIRCPWALGQGGNLPEDFGQQWPAAWAWILWKLGLRPKASNLGCMHLPEACHAPGSLHDSCHQVPHRSGCQEVVVQGFESKGWECQSAHHQMLEACERPPRHQLGLPYPNCHGSLWDWPHPDASPQATCISCCRAHRGWGSVQVDGLHWSLAGHQTFEWVGWIEAVDQPPSRFQSWRDPSLTSGPFVYNNSDIFQFEESFYYNIAELGIDP